MTGRGTLARRTAIPAGEIDTKGVRARSRGRFILSRDDPERYSDEDVDLILRKATELAGQPDLEAGETSSDLSLAEIKAIGAEVGIDPDLIERAARLVPRDRPKTVVERIMGGPLRHSVEAEFPVALTEESATHLLSAVRAETDKQGEGQADAAGMSWHSEPGPSRVSVTAHSDDEVTTVRIGVDRTAVIIPFVVLVLMAVLGWFFLAMDDIESLGDLLEWLVLAAGGLAISRAAWAYSTRAIEARTTALLNAVSRPLADPEGESGDE